MASREKGEGGDLSIGMRLFRNAVKIKVYQACSRAESPLGEDWK
jgi:hypothetical protein